MRQTGPDGPVCLFSYTPGYPSVSNSACHSVHFASLGILRVVAMSACLRFRLRRNLWPLPCSSAPHAAGRAGTPWGGDWLLSPGYPSVSNSVCHSVHFASLGIRQSPRGERATVPTLGPSGRQFRLNCWLKNRR